MEQKVASIKLGPLETFRFANRFIAAHRDGCVCPLCGKSASESDHVFGRGTVNSLVKEHWALRMTLCRKCHHRKHHGAGFNRIEQVLILYEINDHFLGSDEYRATVGSINQDLRDEIVCLTQDAENFIEDWLAKNGPE